MPVPEVVARARLRPIPGVLEYAPGCMDCFYREHEIVSNDGTKRKQFFRCVFSPLLTEMPVFR